jgi:ribonuclease Z
MLNLSGFAIDAISIGGLETCIQLPGLDMAFDIGRCPRSAIHRSRILFTHAHMDHLGGVAMHAATRSLMHMPPPTYYVPKENVDALNDLFAAWRRLDGSDLPLNLEPIGPGDRFDLDARHEVRVFRSIHRVPCQGYIIGSKRRKLRPQYKSLSGREIKRLREDGVEIADERWTAELAFCGDTLIDVIEREPLLQSVRVLILEVTFLDDRVSVEKCRDRGHIHLDEVIERAELFRNQALLFTHFSARYRSEDILRILDERLPPSLRKRVTPLLPEPGKG